MSPIRILYFSDEVPHLKDFKKYCREFLQHQSTVKRPNLSEVLQHNFFNHEFISIYKFLNFLPLKSEEERSQFFSNILENLTCYDEETVAKQLGGLLLSRLTMLDQTARKDVIPFILKPKNGKFLSFKLYFKLGPESSVLTHGFYSQTEYLMERYQDFSA